MSIKVSPSILAAPLTDLRSALQRLDSKLVDFVHLDVMDGHFVPALTFGEGLSKAVAQDTNIPLDVHLMVSRPEHEVPKYFELKPHNITFHIEATSFGVRLAQSIREQGIKAGVALNPATPVEELEMIFPYIDLILIMTVEPGYYGQKFLNNGLEKIKRAINLRDEWNKKYDNFPLIEVDGGVNKENIAAIRESGVNMVVAGSFVFKADDYNERVKQLKEGV